MAGASMSFDDFSHWANGEARRMEGADFNVPLRRSAVYLANRAKQAFHEGRSPSGETWQPLAHPRAHGRGGDKPLRDTDRLMASLVGQAQGHVENYTDRSLTFGTNLDYAAIHQFGGTITPKNAKALTIPLTKEAWRAGGARNFPGQLFVLKRNSKGKAFLAEAKRVGKATKLTLHYLLLSRVTIPARPFLEMTGEMADIIGNIFGEWLSEGGRRR